MNNQPLPTEYNNQRILTTQQVADFYGVKSQRIQQNFNNNKSRFVLGKDYYLLEGEELKKFKNDEFENFEVVNRISRLFLWTEWGCLLHTKSLNTDKAWEVFFALRISHFQLPIVQQELTVSKQEVEELTSKLFQAETVIAKLTRLQANLATLYDLSWPIGRHHRACDQIEEAVANLLKRNTQNNIDRLEFTMKTYLPEVRAMKRAFDENKQNHRETQDIMHLYRQISSKIHPEEI